MSLWDILSYKAFSESATIIKLSENYRYGVPRPTIMLELTCSVQQT